MRLATTMEIEAESIAYVVCQRYGIETGDNSFGYIAMWSKDRTLPELQASLKVIRDTASGLIGKIDERIRELELTEELEKKTYCSPVVRACMGSIRLRKDLRWMHLPSWGWTMSKSRG